MDSGKLYRILLDLTKEEETLNLNVQLEQIKNDFAQNTPDAFTAASEKIKAITSQIESESIVNTFSPSETLFLVKIEGEQYFGSGLSQKLKAIFRSPTYDIVSKLEEFKNKRIDFINKAKNLINSFSEMNIKEWRPDNYEIGLIIPENHQGAEELIEILTDFERLVSGITEGIKGKHESVIINRLSNGSDCFFSPQNADVAFKFAGFLADISTIWLFIESLNKRKKANDEDGTLTEEGRKEMNKAIENEAQRIKNKILDELPGKILESLEKGRDYEVRTKIEFGIHAVFKWIQLGIKLDITPIRIDKSKDDPEQEKETQTKTEIVGSNAKLIHLYDLPLEQRQLPFKLPEPKITKETAKDKPKPKTVVREVIKPTEAKE